MITLFPVQATIIYANSINHPPEDGAKHRSDMEKIDQIELKAQFTEEFFEEFQFDAEFRSLFESMARGLTPYEAIEHLCKSKKELFKSLERAIENTPQRIMFNPKHKP